MWMRPRVFFLFDCFQACEYVADCCRESALRLTDLDVILLTSVIVGLRYR